MAEKEKEKKKKVIKIKVKASTIERSNTLKTTEPVKEPEHKPAKKKETRKTGTIDRKLSTDAAEKDKRLNNTGNISRSVTVVHPLQKEQIGRGRHRSAQAQTTTRKREQLNKEKMKNRQEDILLSKMESSIRTRARKGEFAVPEFIEIGEAIKISDLAKKMNLKASILIQKLMDLGVMTTINDTIDSDTAQILASEFNCKVNVKSLREEVIIREEEDRIEDLVPRPPIVTVMGHVDHGKTQLLDAIRQTDVVSHETGGITQHIGAYKVATPKGEIVFLDTPGHEAFTAMRARGAEVTDIVVLVVSAVEGVMPQTIEAINHAKAANVPIIVAINKMDLPNANPDRVKQQLGEQGIIPEEWGGEIQFVPISALKREGIDQLLESILLQAEIMELKGNPHKQGVGYVLESKMDIGKGAVATVIIRSGKISLGDSFVAGITMGKVRAMFNHNGERINLALPSDPVEIMGFNDVPNAGDKFNIVESEEFAKDICIKRQNLKKIEDSKNIKKIQMQQAMDRLTSPDIKELNVIIKADVDGSVEAIKHSLQKMELDDIKIHILHSGLGAVSESDVMLASATASSYDRGVIILAFRVRIDSIAKEKAESEGITISRFTIIYELIEYVQSLLEGMLTPEVIETVLGSAEIKEVFKIKDIGKIAGCTVNEGIIKKSENVRLFRDGVQYWEGKIASLKRFQNDVTEVQEGFDCGISLNNYENFKKGDIIECFTKEVKKRKLATKSEEQQPTFKKKE